MTVGRIGLPDTPAFRRLRLQALLNDPQAFGSTHDEEAQRSFAEWQAWVKKSSVGDTAFIALAKVDGVAVGMAGGYKPDDSLGDRKVVGMWVSPDWRGRGIGRRLLGAVEDWATAAGVTRLLLWVVQSNPAAITLYRSLGFVETGQEQPLPSDHSLMEMQLSKTIEHA